MSAEDLLKTLAGDVPWCYIYDIMGTPLERYIETFSGRHISTSKERR